MSHYVRGDLNHFFYSESEEPAAKKRDDTMINNLAHATTSSGSMECDGSGDTKIESEVQREVRSPKSPKRSRQRRQREKATENDTANTHNVDESDEGALEKNEKTVQKNEKTIEKSDKPADKDEATGEKKQKKDDKREKTTHRADKVAEKNEKTVDKNGNSAEQTDTVADTKTSEQNKKKAEKIDKTLVEKSENPTEKNEKTDDKSNKPVEENDETNEKPDTAPQKSQQAADKNPKNEKKKRDMKTEKALAKKSNDWHDADWEDGDWEGEWDDGNENDWNMATENGTSSTEAPKKKRKNKKNRAKTESNIDDAFVEKAGSASKSGVVNGRIAGNTAGSTAEKPVVQDDTIGRNNSGSNASAKNELANNGNVSGTVEDSAANEGLSKRKRRRKKYQTSPLRDSDNFVTPNLHLVKHESKYDDCGFQNKLDDSGLQNMTPFSAVAGETPTVTPLPFGGESPPMMTPIAGHSPLDMTHFTPNATGNDKNTPNEATKKKRRRGKSGSANDTALTNIQERLNESEIDEHYDDVVEHPTSEKDGGQSRAKHCMSEASCTSKGPSIPELSVFQTPLKFPQKDLNTTVHREKYSEPLNPVVVVIDRSDGREGQDMFKTSADSTGAGKAGTGDKVKKEHDASKKGKVDCTGKAENGKAKGGNGKVSEKPWEDKQASSPQKRVRKSTKDDLGTKSTTDDLKQVVDPVQFAIQAAMQKQAEKTKKDHEGQKDTAQTGTGQPGSSKGSPSLYDKFSAPEDFSANDRTNNSSSGNNSSRSSTDLSGKSKSGTVATPSTTTRGGKTPGGKTSQSPEKKKEAVEKPSEKKNPNGVKSNGEKPIEEKANVEKARGEKKQADAEQGKSKSPEKKVAKAKDSKDKPKDASGKEANPKVKQNEKQNNEKQNTKEKSQKPPKKNEPNKKSANEQPAKKTSNEKTNERAANEKANEKQNGKAQHKKSCETPRVPPGRNSQDSLNTAKAKKSSRKNTMDSVAASTADVRRSPTSGNLQLRMDGKSPKAWLGDWGLPNTTPNIESQTNAGIGRGGSSSKRDVNDGKTAAGKAAIPSTRPDPKGRIQQNETAKGERKGSAARHADFPTADYPTQKSADENSSHQKNTAEKTPSKNEKDDYSNVPANHAIPLHASYAEYCASPNGVKGSGGVGIPHKGKPDLMAAYQAFHSSETAYKGKGSVVVTTPAAPMDLMSKFLAVNKAQQAVQKKGYQSYQAKMAKGKYHSSGSVSATGGSAASGTPRKPPYENPKGHERVHEKGHEKGGYDGQKGAPYDNHKGYDKTAYGANHKAPPYDAQKGYDGQKGASYEKGYDHHKYAYEKGKGPAGEGAYEKVLYDKVSFSKEPPAPPKPKLNHEYAHIQSTNFETAEGVTPPSGKSAGSSAPPEAHNHFKNLLSKAFPSNVVTSLYSQQQKTGEAASGAPPQKKAGAVLPVPPLAKTGAAKEGTTSVPVPPDSKKGFDGYAAFSAKGHIPGKNDDWKKSHMVEWNVSALGSWDPPPGTKCDVSPYAAFNPQTATGFHARGSKSAIEGTRGEAKHPYDPELKSDNSTKNQDAPSAGTRHIHFRANSGKKRNSTAHRLAENGGQKGNAAKDIVPPKLSVGAEFLGDSVKTRDSVASSIRGRKASSHSTPPPPPEDDDDDEPPPPPPEDDSDEDAEGQRNQYAGPDHSWDPTVDNFYHTAQMWTAEEWGAWADAVYWGLPPSHGLVPLISPGMAGMAHPPGISLAARQAAAQAVAGLGAAGIANAVPYYDPYTLAAVNPEGLHHQPVIVIDPMTGLPSHHISTATHLHHVFVAPPGLDYGGDYGVATDKTGSDKNGVFDKAAYDKAGAGNCDKAGYDKTASGYDKAGYQATAGAYDKTPYEKATAEEGYEKAGYFGVGKKPGFSYNPETRNSRRKDTDGSSIPGPPPLETASSQATEEKRDSATFGFINAPASPIKSIKTELQHRANPYPYAKAGYDAPYHALPGTSSAPPHHPYEAMLGYHPQYHGAPSHVGVQQHNEKHNANGIRKFTTHIIKPEEINTPRKPLKKDGSKDRKATADDPVESDESATTKPERGASSGGVGIMGSAYSVYNWWDGDSASREWWEAMVSGTTPGDSAYPPPPPRANHDHRNANDKNYHDVNTSKYNEATTGKYSETTNGETIKETRKRAPKSRPLRKDDDPYDQTMFRFYEGETPEEYYRRQKSREEAEEMLNYQFARISPNLGPIRSPEDLKLERDSNKSHLRIGRDSADIANHDLTCSREEPGLSRDVFDSRIKANDVKSSDIKTSDKTVHTNRYHEHSRDSLHNDLNRGHPNSLPQEDRTVSTTPSNLVFRGPVVFNTVDDVEEDTWRCGELQPPSTALILNSRKDRKLKRKRGGKQNGKQGGKQDLTDYLSSDSDDEILLKNAQECHLQPQDDDDPHGRESETSEIGLLNARDIPITNKMDVNTININDYFQYGSSYPPHTTQYPPYGNPVGPVTHPGAVEIPVPDTGVGTDARDRTDSGLQTTNRLLSDPIVFGAVCDGGTGGMNNSIIDVDGMFPSPMLDHIPTLGLVDHDALSETHGIRKKQDSYTGVQGVDKEGQKTHWKGLTDTLEQLELHRIYEHTAREFIRDAVACSTATARGKAARSEFVIPLTAHSFVSIHPLSDNPSSNPSKQPSQTSPNGPNGAYNSFSESLINSSNFGSKLQSHASALSRDYGMESVKSKDMQSVKSKEFGMETSTDIMQSVKSVDCVVLNSVEQTEIPEQDICETLESCGTPNPGSEPLNSNSTSKSTDNGSQNTNMSHYHSLHSRGSDIDTRKIVNPIELGGKEFLEVPIETEYQ